MQLERREWPVPHGRATQRLRGAPPARARQKGLRADLRRGGLPSADDDLIDMEPFCIALTL